MKMAAAKSRMGPKVEIMPVARPAMMLVAAPVEDFWTMPRTGFLPRPV